MKEDSGKAGKMAIKVGMVSLGCPKNRVDTEIMLGLLASAGYQITPSAAEAEVMVINTCGFITPAKEEAIKAILEAAGLKKEGRLKALLVAGCLAQRYGDQLLAAMPEIDGVIGPGAIGSVAGLLEEALAGGRPRAVGSPEYDYGRVMPRLATTPAHWAYVKIAEGCSNRCAYCAIPGIRGNLRSRPLEVLEAEVGELVGRGVREVILVAQDTTAYGIDLYGRRQLAGLLEQLAARGPDWIRVMYCHPAGFTPDLIGIIRRGENICRYVDLPLQHISGDILKKMNRPGKPGEIRDLIARLRDSIPGLTLRTTFMVGFPGEGEAEFEELYSFVGETRFERLGVFKYSPEEGTPAALIPDTVPEEVKEERRSLLMALQRSISTSSNRAMVGSRVKVLVDGKKPGRGKLYIGRTEGDAPEVDGGVLFSAGPGGAAPGQFVTVRATGAFDYGLRGVMAE